MADDQQRIQTLEAAVRALRDQLDDLRADVATLRGAPPADLRGGSAVPAVAAEANAPVEPRVAAEPPAGADAAFVAGGPPHRDDRGAMPSEQHRNVAERRENTLGRAGGPPQQHDRADRGESHHRSLADRTTLPQSLLSPLERARRAASGDRAPGPSLENLIGRYGTLALATLTILMGVGAFISWAIANARLGPELRVGLGAALALATAATGAWLRQRGTVRFGNTLLGLALAIVHVDAWGAGPNLGIVPPAVALAVAAVASIALAVLAWRSDEETLFCVGAGGALLAPFVTGGGSGQAVVLLTYGWVVTATALAALRARRWPLAAQLLTLAIAVYTAAGLAAADGGTVAERLAPAAFALACAWSALAIARPPNRRRVVRTALLAAAPALLVSSVDVFRPRVGPLAVAIVAAAIAATAFLALFRDEDSAAAWQPVDAVLLPLLALLVALSALPQMASPRGALWAAILAAGAVVAAVVGRDRRPALSDLLALTAALSAGLSVVLAARPETTTAILALAAYAVLLGALQARLRIGTLAAPAFLALGTASAWVWLRLDARPPFAYPPFRTEASAIALAVVAGWWLWAVVAPRADAAGRRAYLAPAALATFWWGRTELAHAGSAELASFLLTLYYAAFGVAAILAGRLRAAAAARHAGLALALYAALRALVGASDLRQVQLRVGSYLLVGAFLLAVAYWYRAAGDAPSAAEPAALPNE